MLGLKKAAGMRRTPGIFLERELLELLKLLKIWNCSVYNILKF